MKNFGLESDLGHGLRVIGRDLHYKLEDSILIDTLLDEIDAFPVSELRCWVIGMKRICWHQVYSNWRVLLQQLVL